MYVCMHVYVCMCIYVYMYIHIYIYIYVELTRKTNKFEGPIRTPYDIRSFKCVCMYLYVHVCAYVYVMYIYIYILYIYMYMYMHMCKYVSHLSMDSNCPWGPERGNATWRISHRFRSS